MKAKHTLIIAMLAACSVAALAQTNVVVDTGIQQVNDVVSGLSGKYGFVSTILLWVGAMRFMFKPLMGFIHLAVKATPTQVDDWGVEKVESSATWKWITWAIDWLCSIKIGPQNTNNQNNNK